MLTQRMATAAPSVATASTHLGYLDALRGIAILMVLAVHASFAAGMSAFDPLGQAAFTGQRGVQLFYMVSAFTLFYTLDTARVQQHATRNFYLRRFFRIAPLFYCDLLFNWAVNGLGGLRPVLFLSAFLFLNGASHSAINGAVPGGWSIAVETTFYLFVPFLFSRIRTLAGALKWFAVATLIVEPISFYLASRSAVEYYIFEWFPVELPVFLLGIVAYMAWKGIAPLIEPMPVKAEGVISRQSLAYLLLLVSAVLMLGMYNPWTNGRLPWHYVHLLPAAFSFLPLMLALAIYPIGFLENRVTRFVGKISYSAYLAHPYLLELILWGDRKSGLNLFSVRLHHTVAGAALALACLVALVVPVCVILWRFIEQPGIRLGRRLIGKLDHRRAAQARDLVPSLQELERPNTPDGQF